MMKPAQVVKALSALAQPTRLALYRLLVARGPEGMAAGQASEKPCGVDREQAGRAFHLLRRELHRDE
jgi:ArsR family transcriptional regulator